MAYLPDPQNLTDVDKYWVGYFRADGSLSSMTAQFVQADQLVVQEFCRYLGLPEDRCREYRATAVKGGQQFTHYRMTYAPLYRVYFTLGVKSQLTDQTLVDSAHFWRGLVDGDGSLGIRKDTATVLRLCGTLEDVEAFSKFCHRHLLSFKPAVTPTGRIFATGVTGDKARYISRLLYGQGGYSANRKKSELARLIYIVSLTQ